MFCFRSHVVDKRGFISLCWLSVLFGWWVWAHVNSIMSYCPQGLAKCECIMMRQKFSWWKKADYVHMWWSRAILPFWAQGTGIILISMFNCIRWNYVFQGLGILENGAFQNISIKTALCLLIWDNVKVVIHLLVACCVWRILLTALHIGFCLITLIILLHSVLYRF